MDKVAGSCIFQAWLLSGARARVLQVKPRHELSSATRRTLLGNMHTRYAA